jgi:hypothetical protein
VRRKSNQSFDPELAILNWQSGTSSLNQTGGPDRPISDF